MKKILIILISALMLVSSAACTAEAEEAPVLAAETKDAGIEAFGVVKAAEVKNITLEFQAPIKKIHVKEGERVSRGQTLVSLDLTEIENTISAKELSLNAAENEVSRTKADTDMKKLLNDQKNALSIYNKSAEELKTKEALYTAGSIPLSELDSFRKLVDGDKKDLEDITFAIENLKNNKGSANDQKSLEAALLENELSLLKNRLERPYIKGTDIISDITNGIVCEIGCIQGDIANPQSKLLTILDLDSLEIEADIPEEFYVDVKVGARVSITPVTDKSKHYSGVITYVAGRASDKNGETQIPATISIDNGDGFLLPGFNVDIVIEAGGETA